MEYEHAEQAPQESTEAQALMRRYKQTGDINLRNDLVMHYLQHVNVAIYSMRSILLSSVPFEDFYHQGVVALIECIERYDPDRGATFETYSYMGIRGAMLKYLRKQHWVPNRVWEARKRITAAQKELEQTLMRYPTDRELAEHLEMDEQELWHALGELSFVDTLSFDQLLEQSYEGATQQRSLHDLSGGGVEAGLLREEMQGVLGAAIDRLPPKQKQIVALYYYEKLNLREIGEVLGLSQQRISQLRKKALEQLRGAMEDYQHGEMSNRTGCRNA